MKKRILILGTIVAAIVIGGYLIIYGFPGSKAVEYDFATITRGDIENTVSSTGTLSPVTTVEIGTQVSGTIDSVFVDFNDIVREGQVLAVLDTALLKAMVLDAEATLERGEAQLEKAQAEYDRNQTLFNRGLISEADFLPYQVEVKTQLATIKSATAGLDRARRNLEYAVIRSPIDGIVIGKSVEAGQTVAASLSTPTLFIIAQNLSSMEILAEVDESDIGQVKVGQDVRFEVAAYADREFSGKVRQIRLQPKTISNVVTYTAVVEAENDDGLLLPGMTTTIDFITEKRVDVLLVPGKALRFQPTQEQMQELFTRRQADAARAASAHRPDSGSAGPRPSFGMGDMTGRSRPRDVATVWYVDSVSQLTAAPLRTGLSDGANSEVLASRVLTEGVSVIIGTKSEESSDQERTSSPAGAGRFGGRRPPF